MLGRVFDGDRPRTETAKRVHDAASFVLAARRAVLGKAGGYASVDDWQANKDQDATSDSRVDRADGLFDEGSLDGGGERKRGRSGYVGRSR
jgi:hypothetical protein